MSDTEQFLSYFQNLGKSVTGPGNNPRQGAWESGIVGEILSMIGTPERLAVAATLKPLVEAISPDAKHRLSQFQGDVYAGDVIDALVPGMPTALRMGSHVASGMAFDPLTYLSGIGGLTKAGQAARIAGSLPSSRVAQVATGHRALLSVSAPFSAKQLHLGGNAMKRVAEASDAMRAGHFAEATLQRIGIPHVGKFMDDFATGVAHKLRFNFAVDPYLFKSFKDMNVAILGRSGATLREGVDIVEAALSKATMEMSQMLGIPEQHLYPMLRQAAAEAFDINPAVRVAVDEKSKRAFVTSAKGTTEFDRVVDVIHKARRDHIPAHLGGPPGQFDLPVEKQIRDVNRARAEYMAHTANLDQQRLGYALRMVTSPGMEYQSRLVNPEALKQIRQVLEQQGVPVRQANPLRGPQLDDKVVHELMNRFSRTVDGDELARMANEGFLAPLEVGGVLKDPVKVLREHVGAMGGHHKVQEMIGDLIDAKRLTMDSPDASNYVGKLYPVLGVEDANKWVHMNGISTTLSDGRTLELVRPGTLPDFFTPDPLLMDVTRSIGSTRAHATHEFLEKLKSRTSIVKRIEDGVALGPEWVSVDQHYPQLKGYLVHQDQAKFLRNISEVEFNIGKHLNQFAHMWSFANRGIRAWTLTPFLPYYLRNTVGSAWLYYVNNLNMSLPELVKGLRQGVTAWNKIRKTYRAADRGLAGRHVVYKAADGNVSLVDLWRRASDRNLWGSGSYYSSRPTSIAREIEKQRKWIAPDPQNLLRRELMGNSRIQTIKRTMGKQTPGYVPQPVGSPGQRLLHGFAGDNSFVEAGFKLGSAIDDHFRMSTALAQIKKLPKGMSKAQANAAIDNVIDFSKKIHGDYMDVSPFERNVLREQILFYNWFRFNIPNQLQAIWNSPGRINRFHNILQGYEGGDRPPEEAHMSEWMKNNFAVRIKKDRYFIFRNWHPLVDIGELFNIAEFARQSMHPIPKTFFEQLSNENYFTRRTIDRLSEGIFDLKSYTHGERTKTFGLNMPNRVRHTILTPRLMNAMHDLVDNPSELEFNLLVMKHLLGRVYPLNAHLSLRDLEYTLQQMQRSFRGAARKDIRKTGGKNVFRMGSMQKERIMRKTQGKERRIFREGN